MCFSNCMGMKWISWLITGTREGSFEDGIVTSVFWDVTPCRLVNITDITERKILDFIFRVKQSKLFPTLGFLR